MAGPGNNWGRRTPRNSPTHPPLVATHVGVPHFFEGSSFSGVKRLDVVSVLEEEILRLQVGVGDL
jgi:hypothetical protein